MQCNIDARGKFIRLLIGLGLVAVAIVHAVTIIAGLAPGGLWWALTGCIAGAGAFGVFEYRAGWCLMRGLGFKTPF